MLYRSYHHYGGKLVDTWAPQTTLDILPQDTDYSYYINWTPLEAKVPKMLEDFLAIREYWAQFVLSQQ